MENPYKKITLVFHELGFLDAFYYLCDRLLKRVSAGHIRIIRYHIVAQAVTDKFFCPERRGRNVSVREIKFGDELEVDFPVGVDVLAERYAQGCRCLVAEKEGEFVGYLWFVKGEYIEDEVRVIFQLPNGHDVWDFDVYVEPKHRVGFVFLRLWDELYVRLNKECGEYSYSRISAFNAVSRNSHKRLGAKTLSCVSFLKIGSIQIMFSGLSPYSHISLTESSIPKILLPQLWP